MKILRHVVCICALATAAAGQTLADLGPPHIIELKGATHHVQGVDFDGRRVFVTSVDSAGRKGYLHEFSLVNGNLVRSVEVQDGDRFHPGGIAADSSGIWVPVAEYRRASTSVIQRRSKRTLKLESWFTVNDHIGCLAVAPDILVGGNWDSREFYVWSHRGQLIRKIKNPTGNAYQDMKFDGGRLVASGLLPDRSGAIDWLEWPSLRLVRRLKAGKTDRGVVFTQEGMAIHGNQLLLLPEDGPSRLFVFRLALGVSDVFRGGEGGYHTFRIPALAVTRNGTLLAFAEGRKSSARDSGDIDLLVKRSSDNGNTWSAPILVFDAGDDTVGNPAPVLERRSGTIWLLLTRNPGRDTEKQIVEGTASGSRTVWITSSTDDGLTWAPPREITAGVKPPGWTWYATGPGNGIQLGGGRLVVPCDHIFAGSKAMHSHVIYSDDRGRTWKLGGSAGEKTNESAVAELPDGTLMLNMRSYHGRNRRAVATSRDRGLTWSETTLDEALVEPVCQASLIRAGNVLLFSNPADTARRNMTVKLSRDGGRTWPIARRVHEGPAAYSSLAELKDGSIGLLYECGEAQPYERIAFVRFPLGWLEGR